MEIRYMTSADNRMTISRVYEESWKSAYKNIIPQDYLDSIPEGQWASNMDDPAWKTLVCIEDGIIVGTSSFCSSRLEQFDGWGEVISIYLLPDYMGKGYGKSLMESAIAELKKLGYENIFLWVLEENARARRFYEKFGFAVTDDFLDDNIGGRGVREIRYVYTGVTMKLKNILITVNDMEKAKAFYKELFDLHVVLDNEENVIMTEGLVLQDVLVWKDTVGGDIIGHNNASEIYFEVNDIEAFAEKLARYKEPVEYVTPLASNGLGKKVIRFYDPDGNLIEVGVSI